MHPDLSGAERDRSSLERNLRRAEWFGAAIVLFVMTGAVFPLLMEGPDHILDAFEKARLRLLFPPVYVLTLILLARRPYALLLAGMRNVPMLMLLSLPMMSVWWSISSSLSLRRALALVLSTTVAYLLAVLFTARQQLLLLGSVVGGVTLLSLLAGLAIPGLSHMPDDGALRGIFLHKNVLGWMASFTAVFGVAGTFDPLAAIRRAGWALLAISLAALIMCTSATGLLAGFSAILLSVAVRVIARRRGLARLVAQLLIVFFAALIAAALALGALPLLEALGKDATLTGRVPLWHLADSEITRSPMLGYGYGAFWSEANPAAWRIWADLRWKAPHAHNGYRDILLGVGITGMVLFWVVTIRALRQGIDLCTVAPRDGWLWCVLAIGTTLVLNLSESTFLMQNDLIWILFSTAVLTISMRHAELRHVLPDRSRFAIAAV